MRRARLDRHAVFEGLGYVPHAGQAEVHASTAPRRVVACGTRWGKSTVGIYEAILALLEPRESSLGWIVAPTFELTSRIFAKVVAILHDRFKHRMIEFDARGHRIVLANLGGGRSELRTRSADRPAGLLGEALDFLVIDEAAKLRDEVWDEHLAPRLIDRRGVALILSTPTGPTWFYRAFRRGQKGRDPEWKSWAMPTSSNPHIPHDQIEAERVRLPPHTFASQYLAQFEGVENEPCDVCHGPHPDAIPVVVVKPGEDARVCSECDRPVHKDGSTAVVLWPDGQQYSQLVILHPPRGGRRVELPMVQSNTRVATIEGEPIDDPEELPPGID